jgi:tRNA(Ile)-lysidine synthase
MQLELEERIAGFMRREGLFGFSDNVLLGVSGGADSTFLLHVMISLKRDGILSGEIFCAHINHHLRGAESEADEEFVAGECEKLNIPLIRRGVDVRGHAREAGLSIETAARELRIRSLVEVAKGCKCEIVATGHQRDDNAETVLQRLVRGTGFRGLGGIWPVRKFEGGVFFVRPLLCVRRSEVLEYLGGRGLKWREDSTNAESIYRRNYIRHFLLPEIQKGCKASIVERLWGLSEASRGFYKVVCRRADEMWGRLAECSEGKVLVELSEFAKESEAVKVELVRRSLSGAGIGERALSGEHFGRILELARSKVSGREVELPGGVVVCREYGKLVFERSGKEQLGGVESEGVKFSVPVAKRFGDYLIEAGVFDVELGSSGGYKAGKTSFVEWFDFEKIKLPLEVRVRRAGDVFFPLGMKSEKKVGKFLTAQRVPRRVREKVLIVSDTEKILWVWPIRMSEQVKVTGQTRKIVRLQITAAGQE